MDLARVRYVLTRETLHPFPAYENGHFRRFLHVVLRASWSVPTDCERQGHDGSGGKNYRTIVFGIEVHFG